MIFQEVPLNVVLTIYSEDIDEDYIYGKIVMRNEEEVIIAQINDKGESDGYLYLQWEGIYRIDYESSYEEKIERLYQAKNQYHEELMFPKKEDTLLKNLLNWAFCEKKIVSIYFADSDMELEGYLKNAQGSQIAQVDVYEAVFEAGNSFVDVTKAQYIHVDSKRARDAEIVLRYKENEQ